MSSTPRSSASRDNIIQSIMHDSKLEDMDLSVLSECCTSLCSAVLKKLQETDLQELTNTPPPSNAAATTFSTRSTVGVMFNCLVIEAMVVGGPAYNSGQLEPGDTILQIDHSPVTAEGLQQALIGSDVPGTTVTLTVRKARAPPSRASEGPNALWYLSTREPFPDQLFNTYLSSGGPRRALPPEELPLLSAKRDGGRAERNPETREVVLTRMASAVIAERRRMFELFTAIKALPPHPSLTLFLHPPPSLSL